MNEERKSQAIERELKKVQGNKELLDPTHVVEWAQKHPKSALHGCFTWDDAEAAREHRIWQARRLIALHVVTNEGERKTVSLIVDRAKGGGYRQIEDVMRVPALRKHMLSDALAELKRVRARYAAVKELAAVYEAIDAADAEYGSAESVA